MWALTNDSRYLCDADRPTNESGEIYEDANNTGLYFYISTGGTYVTAGSAVITYINDADSSTNNPYYNSEWTTGYDLTGTLTIPETVKDSQGNEYPVAHIGAYAFYKTGITGALIIPACINELGRSAFESCTGIESVTLDYSATALQEENGMATANSFYGCSGIKTVYLNRDVNDGRSSSASNYAYLDAPFSYLTSIETIYVGEEVTKIPYNMFNCNGSSSCALSTVYCYATNHVPSLDFRSFGQHTGLTLYVYDELVENFAGDHQTYTDNYSNTSGGWGDTFTVQGMGSMPTTLEDGTYKDVATGLYFELDEDTGVVSIYYDEAGVYSDENLVPHSTITGAYTFPEEVEDENGVGGKVTRIEAGAFEGSAISGHIVIPAFITAIGAEAFKDCTQITEVTYEYSATALKDEATGNNDNTESFNGCTGVTTVNLYRNIEAGHGSNICTPFAYYTAISTINIGPRVTEIPHHIFNTNKSTTLKTINCYAAVPPTLGNATFRADYLNSGFVVNVPSGAKEAYLSDSSTYSWPSLFASTTYSYTLEGHIAELSNAYAVEISLNNDDGYYATYYNSKAVDIYPQGGTENDVTTYAATGVDVEDESAYIVLEEVGATVPGGVAVLVEANAEGTYTVIETTAAKSASYTGENYLYGYDADTQITAPGSGDYYYYTLSHYNDVLGFWWHESDGSAFTSAAHKAYLALEQGTLTGTKGIMLKKGEGGNDTTGISSVESATESATVKGIYTIQGVRVSNMNQPGLYIVDGKKVLVK